MRKINCVVIDDEIAGRIVIKELLSLYFTDINLIGEAGNIKDGFDLINSTQPDLVFLDIQMPGGDGFELLKKFEKISFDVVFVTSFDQYAINAIKFSALDFLLKPLDVQELTTCIQRVREKKRSIEQTAVLITNLLKNLSQPSKEKKLPIHVLDKVKFIDIESIVYIEANGSYSDVHCADKEKYITSKSLKDVELILEDIEQLIRINKSIIINLKYINHYTKGDTCIITLTGGQQFEISRRKKQEINGILDNLFL